MTSVQWMWIAVAGMGLIAILFFNRQLRAVVSVVRNAVLGGIGIWLCNMLLAPFGLAVGINLLTVFIVGVLGIPGFVLLYVTQWMIG